MNDEPPALRVTAIKWIYRIGLASLALGFLAWIGCRPSVTAAVSPDAQLEARVSRQGSLLQFLCLFGNTEDWLRRYTFVRVELIDRASQKTAVVLDDVQPADAWEDWIEPTEVKWRPNGRSFIIEYKTGLTRGNRMSFNVSRRPLTALKE